MWVANKQLVPDNEVCRPYVIPCKSLCCVTKVFRAAGVPHVWYIFQKVIHTGLSYVRETSLSCGTIRSPERNVSQYGIYYITPWDRLSWRLDARMLVRQTVLISLCVPLVQRRVVSRSLEVTLTQPGLPGTGLLKPISSQKASATQTEGWTCACLISLSMCPSLLQRYSLKVWDTKKISPFFYNKSLTPGVLVSVASFGNFVTKFKQFLYFH